MAKEPILDMLRLQRLTEKRIRAKINHTRREIVASSPVGIDLSQLFWREGRQNFGCASHRFSPEKSCVLNCAQIKASNAQCSSPTA
jgi:hypothetical protein